MEIYPFTLAELPLLEEYLENHESLVFNSSWHARTGVNNEVTHVSVLLSLAMNLWNNIPKLRQFNQVILDEEEQHDEGGRARTSLDLFIEIVRDWIIEIIEHNDDDNNQEGRANLAVLVKTLIDTNMATVASAIKSFCVEYYQIRFDDRFVVGPEQIFQLRLDESPPYVAAPKSELFETEKDPTLSNSVIVQEMFQKLRFTDQKAFRQSSKHWQTSLLKYWRENSVLKLYRYELGKVFNCGNCTYANGKEVQTIRGYVDSYVQVPPSQLLQLATIPYESYNISYGRHPSTALNTNADIEATFWRNCGADIKELQLCCIVLDFEKKDTTTTKTSSAFLQENANNIEWLITQGCPNLKKLAIHRAFITPANEIAIFNRETNHPSSQTTTATTATSNLQMLKLCPITNQNNYSHLILEKCPKLKHLYVESGKDLYGLLRPTITVNKDPILLHTLDIEGDATQFEYFKQYVELYPSTLLILRLGFLMMDSMRQEPYDLYKGIAQCKSLENIEMQISLYRESVIQPTDWFFELSTFSFPNLSRLDINFESGKPTKERLVKFDFATLKNMPLLVELSITYEVKYKGINRSPGQSDWVYEEGESNINKRNRFLPQGFLSQYVPEKEVCCNKLRKFTFTGWDINKEDVELFGKWFPNITHLYIHVNSGDTVALFPIHWRKLQKIRITIDNSLNISLRHFAPIFQANQFIDMSIKFTDLYDTTEFYVCIDKEKSVLFYTKKSSE